MNESSNKRMIIVGLFIFVGILFLAGGIFIVGNLHKTFEKRIELTALFNDVAGLQVGNNVWLSGVKVGTVSNLAFSGKHKVRVRISVEERAKKFIPVDAQVKISSDGFIGNKIMVIFGGTEIQTVENGSTLIANESFSSEDVINTLQENNKNLLIITSNLKILSSKLLSGEGTVGKLLNDNQIYENIQSATSALATALENTQQLTHSLSATSAKMTKKGTLVNDLLTDTVLYPSLKESLFRLHQIADTATHLVQSLKEDGTNPNTSLGILLKDEKSGSNLKETLKNLESSSARLNEDLEALQHSFLMRGYFKKKAKAENKN